jgi:MYXO-CTERM domain-containing protein
MVVAFRSQVPMLAAAAALAVISRAGSAAAADTVVQVPCDGLLTGRTVATFTGGMVVPWVATQGVDGNGNGDGYVTTAVEAELVKQGKTVGGVAGKALPDDGLFPMDARHPAIQLHFSNAADKASPQTLSLHQGGVAPQSFQLPVPAATYSKMFLILTSSEGAGALTITLNYAGGAAPVVTKLSLPDYGVGGAAANDKVFFNLIEGMRKWGSMLNEGDGPSHTITGIELAPSATDKLTSIGVEKTGNSYVVFWGATGIATSPVDIGAGGGGTGGGGAAGASGAAGAGGTPTGGAGGAAAAGAPTAGAPGAGGAAGSPGAGIAGVAGTLPMSAQAGSSPTGTAGSTSGVTPAAASTDSGGCALRDGASDAGGWLVLLVAGGLVLRRRRAGVSG